MESEYPQQMIRESLRKRLLEKTTVWNYDTNQMPLFDSLIQTEWSPRFENLMIQNAPYDAVDEYFLQLMKNRLVQGAFRYGLLHAEGKKNWDRISSAKERIRLFRETGNGEHLIDVANMMLLEFEEGNHPKAHIGPTATTVYIDNKLELYEQTGNLAYLVRVAQFMCLWFCFQSHENFHFNPVGIDAKHHTEEK